MDELSDLLATGVLEEQLQPSEWDTLRAAFDPESAREEIDWRDNALVDWLRYWDLSATGYARAATILTNWTLGTRGHHDLLVYPILFLFRHHLEVHLKDIIALANGLCGRDYSAPTGHDLGKLWEKVRELATELRLPTGEAWEYVGRCIQDLSEVDPTSQAFRYHRDREGKDLVWPQPGSRGEKTVRKVNLRALGRTMARVIMMLDGVEAGLDEMQSYRELAGNDY